MTTSSSTAAPRKKRRIGKIIGIIFCVLIVLLVVGYFVATSPAFFKNVILPRVAASMNSSITVADAKISPFSQVILTKLQITPNGKETLLKADEVRARYNLMDIIRGKMSVNEATVISPIITLVEAPDGSSNMDPLTKKKETVPKEKKKKEKAATPPNLNIHNVSLKNANVLKTKNLGGGGHETTELSNLNFSIDQLSNGQPGKLTVAANVRIENIPSSNSTNATSGSMRGNFAGNFDYKLTTDAKPESAKGNFRLDVAEANGQMADLAKLAAIVDCDLTPTDIRQLSLHFEQNGNALGEIRASGPFSVANTEGKLKLEVSSIDHRVLNLAGAASGIDFNSTVISSTSDIAISQKGNAISVDGQLNANKFSLTKKVEKQTTPTMELRAAYQISVDQTTKSALLKKFELSGTQNGEKILNASLSKPMPISWGGASSTPENASLQLAITDLNLADWKSFAGDVAPSGKLNTTLNLISQQAGKQLSLDVTSRIENLSAKFGSNQISNADVELKAKADIADMKKIFLTSYSAQIPQNNQSALTLNGSGTVDLEKKDADIKATMQGALASLFKIILVPDMTASSGTVKFDGQITQRKDAKTVKGNFVLADFSGTYAGSPLDRFGATFDLDVAMDGQNLHINKASGALQQAGESGGTFTLSGLFNSENKTGNLDLKIADVNQNALRPFLAKSLGEKQLVTISINGNATAYLQKENSSIKGNLDVKNLVVRDPKKSQAEAPLSAQLQIDGTKHQELFDLKQFSVTLSPTARAKNQLNITGQLDLSKTNAMKGQLLVQSDSFDVTPFYDLRAAPEKTTSGTAAPTQPSPETKPNQEPDAIKLPVEQVVAEINIGQFYLREVEIKNWRGTAKVEGSRVLLNPFQLTLNGAPVKMDADLNLGVKGYAYDFSASLDKVPLEPMANSFMPDKKGAYQGIIIADAKIKGAGTTGVNLKKTLNGQANLSFTNANIQIVGPKFKKILVPISTVLQIPEIANTPIHWIDAHLNFGDGKIKITNFVAVSDSYRATVQGSVPIADVLTNSPLNKIPVGFELRKALADKARIGGAASADGNYVKLPNLISLSGTLGDPKPEFDKKGLAALAVQTGAGFIGGDTGKVLKGLGGILGGQPAATNTPGITNKSSTNQPATNQINDVIKGFEGLFNKKKKK